jgi:hypothetical protein
MQIPGVTVPLTVNPSIDLGTILTIITMLGSAIAIVVGVRVELKNVKLAVIDFARRLEHHERTVFELAGQVQRLIGQMEGRPEGARTRRGDRDE